MKTDPQSWAFDYETLMNTQPFAGARYSTHHMGMAFELAEEGEVYMISQGSGGGYGDVLERDPDAVMADVQAGYLSGETAREIYLVVYDPDTLAVDLAATSAARSAEREARLARGRPYREFVSEWVTAEPPAHLPYYGSWGDDNSVIHATAWTMQGPARVAGAMSELPQIFLPDPHVLALAVQQARIADLEARLQEIAVAVQQARIADLARLQERERSWPACWPAWTRRPPGASARPGSTRPATARPGCWPAARCRGRRRPS
jgi:hypothetical protein